MVLTGLTATRRGPTSDGRRGPRPRSVLGLNRGSGHARPIGTDIRSGGTSQRRSGPRLSSLDARPGTPSSALARDRPSRTRWARWRGHNCDCRLSNRCVYSSTMAWRSATRSPLPPEATRTRVLRAPVRAARTTGQGHSARPTARASSIFVPRRLDISRTARRVATNASSTSTHPTLAPRQIEHASDAAEPPNSLPSLKAP